MIPREKLTGGGDQCTSGSCFRYIKKVNTCQANSFT